MRKRSANVVRCRKAPILTAAFGSACLILLMLLYIVYIFLSSSSNIPILTSVSTTITNSIGSQAPITISSKPFSKMIWNPPSANGACNKNSTALVSYDNKPVPQYVLSSLEIPNNISNQVGIGTARPSSIFSIDNAPSLTLNDKPEILYIGAEFCPYCAAERWAIIMALLRFGNFSNLHFMTSSATDYAPSTPTFTFYNSTYTSSYISFVGIEETTNQKTENPTGFMGYGLLQQPNSSEQYIFSTIDLGNTHAPPKACGGIPFVDFANSSAIVSAGYDPLNIFSNGNWGAVVSMIYNTSSLQSQAIIGEANLLTAKICEADNNAPQSVCSQPYAKNIENISR